MTVTYISIVKLDRFSKRHTRYQTVTTTKTVGTRNDKIPQNTIS